MTAKRSDRQPSVRPVHKEPESFPIFLSTENLPSLPPSLTDLSNQGFEALPWTTLGSSISPAISNAQYAAQGWCSGTCKYGRDPNTMCGRYVFLSPLEAIQQMFKFDQMPNLGPNYNVAPTHEMPIVRRRKGDRRNELVIARWGLIPHWAKNTKIAYSTINARAETAASKPAFRDAFKRRRCLVPADAFYEWKRAGKEKQPYLIRMKDGGPFAFAGLWSTWRSPDGEDTESYTIMTTEPNDLMAELHNRMPVILGPDVHDRWLDLAADPADVLKPCPTEWLETFPVDKRVGNVRNNDDGLIEPLSA